MVNESLDGFALMVNIAHPTPQPVTVRSGSSKYTITQTPDELCGVLVKVSRTEEVAA